MDAKITVLKREEKIKGVKHFKTLNEAMIYVGLKYGIEMELNKEIPGYTRGSWEGKKIEKYTTMTAYAPQGVWRDDVHELEVKETNVKEGYYDRLIEFVTFEKFRASDDDYYGYDNSYRYTYRNYDKEYNFK